MDGSDDNMDSDNLEDYVRAVCYDYDSDEF